MRPFTPTTAPARHQNHGETDTGDVPRRRSARLRIAGVAAGLLATGLLAGACSSGGAGAGAAAIGHSVARTTSSSAASVVGGGQGSKHPSVSFVPNGRGRQHPTSPATSQPTSPVTFNVTDSGGTYTYTLQVNGIVRQGPFVHLDLTFGCRTVDGCSGGTFASGGHNYSDDSDTLDGLDLVDPAGKTLYQPVYDADGHPLSSVLPYTLQAGATQQAWVTFPAPPASVGSVTVQVPSAGTELLDLPLSPENADWYPQAKGGDFDQPVTSTDTANLRLPVFDLTSPSLAGVVGQTTQGSQTTVTLSTDVLFAFNSAQLTPDANQALASVAKQIDQSGQGTVTVTGYTDNIGSPDYNQQLSQQRAQAVVAALQSQATDSSVNYQAVGMGDANPVAPNTNPDGSDNPGGRAQNRRVTVTYNVGSSDSSTTAPTTGAPAPATASKTATYTLGLPDNQGQETYQVTVNGTQTDGGFTILDATATCERSDNSSGCQTNADFTDGNNSNSTPDGLSLVDYANGTSYYPVQGGGSPVVNNLPYWLPVGSSTPIYAWFGPPAGASLSLQMPSGPVIQP